MLGRNFLAVFLLASCSLAHAYPALLPYIYNPSHDLRPVKRSDDAFPQIEDDVGELDQLRSKHTDLNKRQHEGHNDSTTTVKEEEEQQEPVISNTNTLPDLERQLEVATPLMSTTTTSASATTIASKEEGERSQLEEPKTAARPPPEPTAHSKAFYGAARLAFGQNPEVLPTSSTTTTTSTTTAATALPGETKSEGESMATDVGSGPGVETAVAETVAVDVAGEPEAESALTPSKSPEQQKELNKETIGDILFEQLEAAAAKTAERRSSVPQLMPKTAQSLLRSQNGQYSSFDMAQYVFWTGDEAGVARAVEELINENLITRENALKFLRDIRLGIEFLQRSYANRIFPEELHQNHLKRNSPPSPSTTSTTTSTTTTTSSTTTEKPLPFEHLESALNENRQVKPLDSFSFWSKLRELDHEGEGHQDLTDYDDTMGRGRAKIVEYLYNEYSLEEILYNLARVMFAQSLAHGSDEAQHELQKLTDFLEREGNLGVIPVDLQKKVLRVLLTALSDTLTEHPELLPAARSNLANPYYRLPMHTPSQ
ncbi:uncharacterized protein LOC115620568 isoform X2 [Scaptodrosophila lebanonensis]|uniref:Uncharacterized protein LOC115620568 isoform X2 n=1 Tax=Drosophila lebanonensis TaxID=7225 RepID=A0A6J2T3B7_DROLE|nr:uncharacterized protein LOC115620568 isoform X2 [Scaptodrosophila lebanonensis]